MVTTFAEQQKTIATDSASKKKIGRKKRPEKRKRQKRWTTTSRPSRHFSEVNPLLLFRDLWIISKRKGEDVGSRAFGRKELETILQRQGISIGQIDNAIDYLLWRKLIAKTNSTSFVVGKEKFQIFF